jgi:hypothetical protein
MKQTFQKQRFMRTFVISYYIGVAERFSTTIQPPILKRII